MGGRLDAGGGSLALSSLEVAQIWVNAVTPGMIDTPLWRARPSEPEQELQLAAGITLEADMSLQGDQGGGDDCDGGYGLKSLWGGPLLSAVMASCGSGS